jgi:hypothetical protein
VDSYKGKKSAPYFVHVLRESLIMARRAGP